MMRCPLNGKDCSLNNVENDSMQMNIQAGKAMKETTDGRLRHTQFFLSFHAILRSELDSFRSSFSLSSSSSSSSSFPPSAKKTCVDLFSFEGAKEQPASKPGLFTNCHQRRNHLQNASTSRVRIYDHRILHISHNAANPHPCYWR